MGGGASCKIRGAERLSILQPEAPGPEDWAHPRIHNTGGPLSGRTTKQPGNKGHPVHSGPPRQPAPAWERGRDPCKFPWAEGWAEGSKPRMHHDRPGLWRSP